MITILSRLGHCESYTFILELENALNLALNKASSCLTPNIIRGYGNKLFHSVWDNFDQTLSSIHGPTSLHTSHGMMMQEILGDEDDSTAPPLPQINRLVIEGYNIHVTIFPRLKE